MVSIVRKVLLFSEIYGNVIHIDYMCFVKCIVVICKNGMVL